MTWVQPLFEKKRFERPSRGDLTAAPTQSTSKTWGSSPPARIRTVGRTPAFSLRNQRSPRLVIFASLLSVPLDVFGLLVVDARHGIAGTALCVDQFIELGLDRLRVAVFGALNEQGHEPRGQRCYAVPVE